MKDLFVALSKDQLETMKDRLDEFMEKIRRLEELDPGDRVTRYKKAIDRLLNDAKALALEVFIQELYGGFYAPLGNPAFTACLEDFLTSSEFAASKDAAVSAVESGSVVGFYSACSDVRAVVREIVEAFGGREEWD